MGSGPWPRGGRGYLPRCADLIALGRVAVAVLGPGIVFCGGLVLGVDSASWGPPGLACRVLLGVWWGLGVVCLWLGLGGGRAVGGSPGFSRGIWVWVDWGVVLGACGSALVGGAVGGGFFRGCCGGGAEFL